MKDVLDLDLQLYLRNLLPQEDALLQEMRSFAEEHYISIVDPEVGYLLHLLTGLVQPQTILEIGTAIGCSAIYMARAMEKGTITTIELQEQRHRMALEYFQRAGVSEKIDARLGDARKLVPEIEAQYDPETGRLAGGGQCAVERLGGGFAISATSAENDGVPHEGIFGTF